MTKNNYKNNVMYITTRDYISNLDVNKITKSKVTNDYKLERISYEHSEYIYNLEVANQLFNEIRSNGFTVNSTLNITSMFKYVHSNMYEMIFSKDSNFDNTLKINNFILLNILSVVRNNSTHYDVTYGKYVDGKLIAMITVVYVFDTEWLEDYNFNPISSEEDNHNVLDTGYIIDIIFTFNINDNYKSEHILKDYDMLCTLLDSYLINVNEIIEKGDVGNIKMVNAIHGRYTLKNHKLNMDDNIFTDLDLHYGENFSNIYNDVMKVLKDENHNKGVLLIHGTPGSGKSHLIKNIVYDIKNKILIFLSPDMIQSLTDPSFMTFFTDEVTKFKNVNKNVILIIEEAESILKDRETEFNNSISNLLNISDGMLNNLFGVQVIVTFNTDIKKIDKAILRNHRAIANIRLGYLSKESIKGLCEKLELGDDALEHFMNSKKVTLSDIYSYGNKYNTINYINDNDDDLHNNML